jgi:3-phenylpropionate/cinnamic acid dioxygenase small subunit
MNINCGIETGLSAQDERSIGAVLIAYASAIDSRDWALFRNCFTADCQADYGEFGSWQNIADLTDYMREAHARLGPTLHRISNIKLTNAQSGANATSYVDALLSPQNKQGSMHRGIGRYDDFLVRTGDGWKIARRAFTAMIIG